MDFPNTVANVNLLNGQFTDGDPLAGIPPSSDPSEWANAVTNSILNVQAAAGLAPNEADATQLLQALLILNRIKLTANLTLYVNAAAGNDAHNGLTAGTAFATIQRAINILSANYDLAGFTATIQVADGTDTGGINIAAPFTGGGAVILSGDIATPANCIISTVSKPGIYAQNKAVVAIQGFKIITTTAGDCVEATGGAIINITGPMEYGACAGSHLRSTVAGSLITNNNSNYKISGNAGNHMLSDGGLSSIQVVGSTVTLIGAPAFSGSFAQTGNIGFIAATGNTYAGAATGTRYTVSVNSVINTNGAGANYFPGSIAGTSSNGGLYV